MHETAQSRGVSRGVKAVMGLGILAVLAVVGWIFRDQVGGALASFQSLMKSALEWIEGLGVVGAIVFIGLYAVLTVLLLPGSLLTIASGSIYGPVWGTVVVSAASMLGATSSFLIGRYLARDWVKGKTDANPRFRAVDQAVAKEGWKIVGLTRLSPAFPFVFLNYAYGLTGVSLRGFFFASWVCMLPGTVLYVYVGSLAKEAATEALGWQEWTPRIVGLIATVAVTVYVTKIAKRALSERVDGDSTTTQSGKETA